MRITHFGAALKFAMEKEAQAIVLYEEATRDAANAEMRDLLSSFAPAGRKRKAVLERLYKENMYSDMDTGIFEPLAGLDEVDYAIDVKPSGERTIPDLLRLALDLEDAIERFYRDLASQLQSRRSGVARELVKAAQQNSDSKLKLRSLQNKLSPE